MLLFCTVACVRETLSFSVSDEEQSQNEQYLKMLYDTRAVNTLNAHYENAA